MIVKISIGLEIFSKGARKCAVGEELRNARYSLITKDFKTSSDYAVRSVRISLCVCLSVCTRRTE